VAGTRRWRLLRSTPPSGVEQLRTHYYRAGRLRMTDTRDEAVEQAVKAWASMTEAHPIAEVALISDASNREIHRLNARAQHYR
jgi:hypothetical protein